VPWGLGCAERWRRLTWKQRLQHDRPIARRRERVQRRKVGHAAGEREPRRAERCSGLPATKAVNNSNAGTARPIRVCRVIARLNVGGPAVHVVQLASALDSQRFDQRLVAGRESPHEASMVPLARARGIEPVIVPELGREVDPRDDALALLKLYRLFRAWRPDVVETHTAKAGTLGRIAAVVARVPARVHVFHGHVLRGYFGPVKTRAFLAIERGLARVTTRIIALGNVQRRELLALGIGGPERVVSIPLGFELEPFANAERHAGALRAELGVAADAPLIGILGRLAPIKRHDVFLRAAGIVAGASPAAHFVVIGDGETRKAIERQRAELGLNGRLHLLGWRAHADLPAALADLDVLVNTSDNEGMPVSLIEAMAAGVPVVATAVGGTVSVVEDGMTGVLSPAGDHQALAAGILRLLSDLALRERIVPAAQSAALGSHGLVTLASAMDRFYTSLVSGNR